MAEALQPMPMPIAPHQSYPACVLPVMEENQVHRAGLDELKKIIREEAAC